MLFATRAREKEMKKDMVEMEGSVVVNFQLDKEQFLKNPNEAIKQCLMSGNAFIKPQEDHFFNGALVEEKMGEDKEIPFFMPGGNMKLAYHLNSNIQSRITEIEEEIKARKQFIDNEMKELMMLQGGLKELKKIQCLTQECQKDVQSMHYYEIQFYEPRHEKEWVFYFKSEKKLTDLEVIHKLHTEFMGVDGLEPHHLQNIVTISEISGQEFTEYSGIPV